MVEAGAGAASDGKEVRRRHPRERDAARRRHLLRRRAGETNLTDVLEAGLRSGGGIVEAGVRGPGGLRLRVDGGGSGADPSHRRHILSVGISVRGRDRRTGGGDEVGQDRRGDNVETDRVL